MISREELDRPSGMMTGGNKLKWKESISGLERSDKNK